MKGQWHEILLHFFSSNRFNIVPDIDFSLRIVIEGSMFFTDANAIVPATKYSVMPPNNRSLADLKLQNLLVFSKIIKSVKNAMNKDREELLHEKSKI